MDDDDASDMFVHLQDVLGQLTSLNTYTHMALGFAVDEYADDLAQELHGAAEKLVQAFPFLAGHVIRRGSGIGKTGLATVVRYPAGKRPTIVVAKNCRHLCPSMQTILAAGVPMDMLDGEILAQRKGGPHQYDESEEPAPVLEIQVNIIQGGVIIVFQGNHNIMDMNGMGQIIQLYAKALRREPFNETELREGNRDRRNIVKLLDPSQLPDMSRYTAVAKEMASTPSESKTPLPNARWAYFHFPVESLVELKASASKSPGITSNAAPAPWITTDDALSAWLCQRILNARLQRLPKAPPPKATLCRAINARRFLDPPIPREYLGHAVTCAYTEVSLKEPAATSDLPGLAHRMRSDVLATNSRDIQAFATRLHSLDDKGALSFGARLDMAAFDLTLSSWSALGVGTTGFGEVLGTPAFAKRPRMSPVESLIYLMPRTVEGHVDVACCLCRQDIESLRADTEFGKYGRYIG